MLHNNATLELLSKQYECSVRKEAHYSKSLYYARMDKTLSLPQILLSSVLSTSTFSQASMSDATSYAMRWFIAGSSAILTIITALSRYYDFSSRKDVHFRTSIAYGKLERLIKLKITDDPETNKDVCEQVIEEYNSLKESAPLINICKNDFTICVQHAIEQDRVLKETIQSEFNIPMT